MSLMKFLMEIRQTPSWEREPAISDQELDELIRRAKNGLLHRPLLGWNKRKRSDSEVKNNGKI